MSGLADNPRPSVVLVETYKVHTLLSREITSVSCQDGVQWIWECFYDCLQTTVSLSGYFIGALSLPLHLIGWMVLLYHIRAVSVSSVWTILWLCLLVDVCSLIGVIMSMQIMLLILYDLTTCVLDLFILTYFTVTCCLQPSKKWNFHKHLKLLKSKISWKNLMMMLAFIFILLIISTVNLLNRFPWIHSYTMNYESLLFMLTSGYLIGSISTLLCLFLQILLLKIILLSPLNQKTSWKIGCVLHFISEVMYLIAIFLQSGGLQITIATLPWLFRRFIQASYCLFNLKCWKWALLCFRGNDQQLTNKEMNSGNKIIKFESSSLLTGWESDSSEVNVLYEKPWPVFPAHYKQHQQIINIKQSPLQHMVNSRHDLVSTTESEWTSLSQEQEIMIHQNEMMQHDNQNKESENAFQNLYHNFKSHRPELFLDFTSSVERVKSWISNSTPEEEEVSPSLTFTLNLETTSCETRENYQKIFYSGKLLSPRKNSF